MHKLWLSDSQQYWFNIVYIKHTAMLQMVFMPQHRDCLKETWMLFGSYNYSPDQGVQRREGMLHNPDVNLIPWSSTVCSSEEPSDRGRLIRDSIIDQINVGLNITNDSILFFHTNGQHCLLSFVWLYKCIYIQFTDYKVWYLSCSVHYYKLLILQTCVAFV